MKRYRILFLGTPEFAVPTLRALIANRLSPIAVITEPDRPAGRGKTILSSPVKQIAQKYQIPIFQPEKINNCRLKIRNLQPDVAIVVAYGQIIPREILEIPRYGFLNIHPSLLPKYRGPSPIQAAILNGDKEIGVTIIKLDEKMDHGDIIAKIKYKISKIKNNYQDLSDELANLGVNLLIKVLPGYLSGKIKPRPQNHSQATYTQLIKKEDGLIDWNKPIEYIERQIRAFTPWPGSYTIIDAKRLKICQAHLACGKLIIDQVQLEGRKIISWKEFQKGYKKPISFLDNLG